MGVLSEAYIMQRIDEFIKSDAGRAKLPHIRPDLLKKGIGSEVAARSKEDAENIMYHIRDELRAVIEATIASFRLEAIYAEFKGFDNKGQLRASISVDESALRRESLHYMNRDRTIGHGEGVDDILALFAHGYSIDKRPYGFWVRDGGSSMTRIGARMHRDPNPFLINFVNEINAEYKGKCVVTLNNEYKTKGGGQ